jgi:NAD(P)-dependent dehydrogenase (short-subunit alcohol dehydrogenase family)
MSNSNNPDNERLDSSGPSLKSRRDLLRAGAAMAVGAFGGAAMGTFGGATAEVAYGAKAPPVQTQVFPVYFPLTTFVPDFDIMGKFAVITGASRGIGRATAEALVAKGVYVIGTSRNVRRVPNPPTTFPLLDLDITSDTSVKHFVSDLLGHSLYPGHIDILINNAGREVFGTPVPPPVAGDPTGYFLVQAQLARETVYGGHTRVTYRLLPYMAQTDYSRLLFTVSSAAYTVGGSPAEAVFGDGAFSYLSVYTSAKRALLAYANNLRGYLRATGSPIKVSTVNPYGVRTTIAEGLNPVYTEPVDSDGNSSNPALQAVLDAARGLLKVALPPSYVGETYAQLLSMTNPYFNVAVAAPIDTFNAEFIEFVNSVALAENQGAALRFGCGT